MVRRFLDFWGFGDGIDECHETLKWHHCRTEKGHVEYKNGGFVWITDRPESH